jgi:hypothetical protein
MEIEKIDLKNMTDDQLAKTAQMFADLAAKTVNNAVKRVNNKLSKIGYKISVDLNFHEIKPKKGE